MKIIECPRDAWQGYHPFIPTDQKIAYLNQLLRVGFDTIDFGSFVSATAMPQVSDTAALLEKLDLSVSASKLLAIVANERGAQEACTFEKITYLGYPFSISETFQLRNTNATIEESLLRVQRIAALCEKAGKELVIYLSMGFGNPYGDVWNPEIVMQWVEKLSQFGIKIFSLADTVGVAKTEDIQALFSALIPKWPDLEFGAHFHTTQDRWEEKTETAYLAGCRRFDGALLGYGGCPMAQNDLIGNMPSERLIDFAKEKNELINIDLEALDQAKRMFLELISN
ncbi:hydroxymethylglutaryl-CoA lyase [Dyadobacter psychrotolerans]|uniref:Hydroxymethylglutaryl-CoA lyase n=1 Tax=Dyadobacter psychrotolerans TaxID=2541721 RepID=A0A4V2Z3A5_9BACT|nr:hydroxymethylglutaryl-CoA lyase [Dyadobacter psychrotolerans]TDE11988.1 hydroxymethylglutaryl-CoA lyase [Dyadobacter psychrotolerans]